MTDDELAVERYRYLLRTAPPESIEAVHAEAFAKLTPQQRHLVYANLAAQLPPGEQVLSEEPSALARAATRAELRQPGTIERTMSSIPGPGASGFQPGAPGYGQPGGAGAQQGGPGAPGRPQFGGTGFGSMFAGSLLGSIAGYVVGSAIVSAFLPDPSAFEASGDAGAGDAGAGDAGASTEAAGTDASGDGGWGDFGGGDFGGGDFGGDFGF